MLSSSNLWVYQCLLLVGRRYWSELSPDMGSLHYSHLEKRWIKSVRNVSGNIYTFLIVICFEMIDSFSPFSKNWLIKLKAGHKKTDEDGSFSVVTVYLQNIYSEGKRIEFWNTQVTTGSDETIWHWSAGVGSLKGKLINLISCRWSQPAQQMGHLMGHLTT